MENLEFNSQDYISIAEAGRYSGFGNKAILELYEDGDIEGYQRRKHCRILISKPSLTAYIKSKSNQKSVRYY